MVLLELSVVEQHYDAVMEVLKPAIRRPPVIR
jgi:hypothetical protein